MYIKVRICRCCKRDSVGNITRLNSETPFIKPPRWSELFLEFFVEGGAEGNDDLLFFVKQGTGPEGNTGPAEQDPIFVRRKVGKTMPSLSDIVDWKQTFFLNLIVQLPCTLTVAVCKRGSAAAGSKPSLLSRNSDENIVVVGKHNTSNGALNSPSPSSSTSIPDNVTASSSPTISTTSKPKSKMIAIQRIPKTVYAAPYKSRMDVKDAFMNECSYPLVYYTVNDYESHDLHLSIRESHYLCVELSVITPETQSHNDGPSKWTASQGTEAIANISLEQDPTPFPVPPGCTKIVLFQGAVPYTSLLDIYAQKGLAARNQLRKSWKKLTEGTTQSTRKGSNDTTPPPERTEYIMMRGPHGKGQCQVAIKDDIPQVQPQDEDDVFYASLGGKRPGSLTDRLLKFGNAVKTQIVAAAVAGGLGGELGGEGEGIKKPESLRCSMTYVNVPWQSIVRWVFCKILVWFVISGC